MSSPPLVALLTDFGTRDPFVGLMKAVIWSRCPGAQIVDLSHAIPPQGVKEGAFWLARSAPWLPEQAVCAAVVDPGVGSERRALVVTSAARIYVGPDNGLLGDVAAAPGARVYVVDAPKLGFTALSATFHGRDLFAPLAAEIAAGRLQPSAVGPPTEIWVPSPVPRPERALAAITGEVIVVDAFGNLITNVPGNDARALRADHVEITGRSIPCARTYSDVAPGEYVALENAFGVLEVARREGSAAEGLRVGSGAAVRVPAGDRGQ